jgi:hypothetical protein
VIVETPEAFRAACGRLPAAPFGPATARDLLLVTPVGFRLDQESRRDNRYMAADDRVSEERALSEHRALVAALERRFAVRVFPGRRETPDAVFPNNAFATAPGRAVVGRMRHAVRRGETARRDLRDFLEVERGYELTDLSRRDDLVAELTGPLVIDRLRGIGYCGLSERCDRAGAEAMHAAFGLRLTFIFTLAPEEYHTNVFMSVLAGRALIVHPGSFADPAVPDAVAAVYGERVLQLSDAEKRGFVGNSIALGDGELWLSCTAERALRPESRAALERWGFTLHCVPLDEIEKSGGSLRCCVAELF